MTLQLEQGSEQRVGLAGGVAQHAGTAPVPPEVVSTWTAAIASRSVVTLTRVMSVFTPARSAQFPAGTRKTVAPAFSAPAIFSWIPPIEPT